MIHDARPWYAVWMRLGIFAPTADLQAGRLATTARQAGHDVVWRDLSGLVRGEGWAIDLQTGRVACDAGEAGTVDAWVLFRVPGPVARLAPPGVQLSSEEWFVLAQRQADRAALAWSVVSAQEDRGVPVLSSPSRARPFDAKPRQLAAFVQAALPVPRTVITNDPVVARAFVASLPTGASAVKKPVTGGRPAEPFDDVQLAALRDTPVILQERIMGDDVRVVVVGGVVVGAGRYVVPKDVVDVRLAPGFVDGSLRPQPVALPAHVRDASVIAAAACAYDVAGLDWKVTHDGRYHLLEANRTPVLLDLEDELGIKVSERILAAAIARASHGEP